MRYIKINLRRIGSGLGFLAFAFWANAAAPANDDFGSRAVLVSTGEMSNIGASAEIGEPAHGGLPPSGSLWWSWTPAWTGTYLIDTLESDFDTVLAVYTGVTLSALTEVASNTNFENSTQSRVRIEAMAGTSYQIAVDSQLAATGEVRIRVREANASDSDYRNGPNLRIVPPGAKLRTGDGIVLSVLVSDKQPTGYQWSGQYEQLAGETNAILLLSDVSLGDAGFYSARVQFADGSWQMVSAHVDVIPRFGEPEVEVGIGPQFQLLDIGHFSEWYSWFTAMTPEAYQWSENGSLLEGENLPFLHAGPHMEVGVFRYQLSISNSTGSVTSAEAFLMVTGEEGGYPVVHEAYIVNTNRPGRSVGSLVTFVGKSLGLGVETLSQDMDGIQWWKDGTPLPGGTNQTLTIDPLQLSDSGAYHVTGILNGGYARTATCHVTVGDGTIRIAPPKISVTTDTKAGNPANGVIPTGGQIILLTSPRSVISRNIWGWYKGATVIGTTTTPSFTIHNAKASDSGNYYVREYTTWGWGNSGAQNVQVVDPVVTNFPTIIRQPVSVDVDVGDKTSLSLAVSKDFPTYKQWYHEGVALDGQDGEILVLPEVDLVQSGKYWCVVGNVLGAVTSHTAELVVHLPATVTPLEDIWYFPGETIQIQALARGTGTLGYQWIRDGEPVSDQASGPAGTGLSISGFSMRSAVGADGSVLELGNLSLESAGTISVGVGNQSGTEFSSVANLRPLPPIPSYAAWAASHWPGETNLSVIGWTANPDGDDLPNYAEYAVGGTPSLPDANPSRLMYYPKISQEGVGIEFPIRIAEPNLIYRLHSSSNMVDWVESCSYRSNGSQLNRTPDRNTSSYGGHRYEPPYIFTCERFDFVDGQPIFFSIEIEYGDSP